MRIKLKFLYLLAVIAVITGTTTSYSAVYEASTLHNAVSRSETVQDLFFKRWDIILEQELYFDFYGKLNWVPGFGIRTVNKGTGVKESVDMRLIRTYGSITVNYPILGGYEGTSLTDRMTKGEQKKEEEGGLWKPKNLVLGFTATGFHYGLTRKSDVDRGAAGSTSITDAKFTQFFDDIFAVTVMYRPYFFIHGGIIINNQIDPDDDGTVDYTNSKERTTKYFVASNLLSFLNLNAASKKDKVESIAVGLIINNGLAFLMRPPPLLPKITLTYKRLALFNDEPFDAVWVKTSSGKSISISDNLKQEALLHTFSIRSQSNLFNKLFIDFFIEFQSPSETLVEKRKITAALPTGDTVDYETIREVYLATSYNFLGQGSYPNRLLATFGISRFWDVAIPIHRERGFSYSLVGWFFAVTFENPVIGGEFKVARNYSQELRKLVEIADKYMLEASMYARF